MNIIQSVGRRKLSVARVYLSARYKGISINKRDMKDYFKQSNLHATVKQPLLLCNEVENYGLKINVKGGGTTGQAEAIRLGISQSLVKINPEHKEILRENRFLTRDSRIVERKKYGRKKARKKFQFSKR